MGEIRDLVGKGWLTHDAMWYAAAAARWGVEEANRLNQAAIRAMTPFEVERLAAAGGQGTKRELTPAQKQRRAERRQAEALHG